MDHTLIRYFYESQPQLRHIQVFIQVILSDTESLNSVKRSNHVK